MKDNFPQKKRDVLARIDKSSKKSWDKKIIKLCGKINSHDEYYTTSSCAGRVVLMVDDDKKGPELFLKVYHNLISFEELKKDLENTSNKRIIKFKQEPCILHVACKNLEDARDLYDKAKLVGWKKSGLISWERNIILELNSTEILGFLISDGKNILVDDDFLKIIVKKSNENLKKSWEKIEKLRKLLK